jgi:hypothetical protein
LLLLFCAKKLQQLRPECACDYRVGHAGVDRPELLRNQAVLQKTETCSAVLLIDENTDEAQFSGLSPDTQVKSLVAVKFLSTVGEFSQGEFPCGFLDVSLFFGECEIHEGPPTMGPSAGAPPP